MMVDIENELVMIATEAIERSIAMQWLAENVGVDGWPQYVEGYRSGCMIGNWRFVDTLPDREIVFANMITPSITKQQLADYASKEQKESH